MSLETSKAPRKPVDLPRDKPRSDRTEHANLDERPGAMLHPRAHSHGWRASPGASAWARQWQPQGWR